MFGKYENWLYYQFWLFGSLFFNKMFLILLFYNKIIINVIYNV